jgi:hypothetical protein
VKLAAWLAFWFLAVASSAPALAQDDPPAPFSDPAWLPTTATPEVLAECIASIDAAIEARDFDALGDALRRTQSYVNPELVSVLERALCQPTWPSADAAAEAEVDAKHPARIAEETGVPLSASELSERVSTWEAWRPHGLVAAKMGVTSKIAFYAVVQIATRRDEAAYEALARSLDHEAVAANPLSRRLVVSAITKSPHVTPAMELRLYELLLSVDDIAPESLQQTEFPPYADSPRNRFSVHALPAEAVARFAVDSTSRSRAMLEALADGLLLGSSRFGTSVKDTRALVATDAYLSNCSQIGERCAKALEKHFREPFVWSDRKSHDRARALVEQLAPGVVHSPVPLTPSTARAALERAVESRDGDEIDVALKDALALDPPKLITLLEDVAALPVLSDAMEQAVTDVDWKTRIETAGVAKLAREAGETFDAASRALVEAAFLEWRPIGIEIEAWRHSARHTRRICEYLRLRADADAFGSLVRILKLPAVRANPFSRSEVIRTLALFERSSTAIDDELCKLIASTERIDQEFMRRVPTPLYYFRSPAVPVGMEPIVEAVRYYVRRGTSRRKVVNTLIDGLMFGHDPKEKEPAKVNGSPIVLEHEDPAVEVARAIGRECSVALFACTGEAYPTLSREAQAAAKEWLKREGKDAGFE